jgi:cytochrome c-type biogenesis protein CcmH
MSKSMLKIQFAGLVVLALTLLAGLSPSSAALAQQPTPSDDEVNAIAKQLFCPVCENTPLDVCPTQACAQWRELIREKLAAGWSEEQIKNYFIEQYGARVVGVPPAQGLNWLIYLIPPVAVLAGAFILYKAFRSGKQPAAQSTVEAAVPPPANEYVSRLEEELKKR